MQKIVGQMLVKKIVIVLLLAAAGAAYAQFRIGDKLASPATKDGRLMNYKATKWEELSPKDWDPYASLKSLTLSTMRDGDPRAQEALDNLMASLNNAPIVPAMDKQGIKITGFMIPITKNKDDVISFLLVPYFGACIHTPPPPSNQVLFVVPDKPVKGGVTMDAVTVSGEVLIQRTDSPWGSAGYRVNAKFVDPYVEPKRK